MPTITIQGTTIEFPDSAQSPNTAPAIIAFALAVEAALSGLTGAYDISPQELNVDAFNPGSNVDLPLLVFPPSNVRGAIILYTVYRETTTVKADEIGEIWVVYNPDRSVGNKWGISQSRTSDASISFTITDAGQLQFSTTTLPGLNHTGKITYQAKAILS